MSITNEADVLDVVRRLRKIIGDLDTSNLLAERVNSLNDPMLSTFVERVVGKVEAATSALAQLLRHVENNKSYKDLVKKYRAANTQEDDNGRDKA